MKTNKEQIELMIKELEDKIEQYSFSIKILKLHLINKPLMDVYKK